LLICIDNSKIGVIFDSSNQNKKDMKACAENFGETFKVRLSSYSSFRHYGGREITTYPTIVDCILIGLQSGHQRYIVELINDCVDSRGKLIYRAGAKIAVCENDFAL
jgi:hypothetical protein